MRKLFIPIGAVDLVIVGLVGIIVTAVYLRLSLLMEQHLRVVVWTPCSLSR